MSSLPTSSSQGSHQADDSPRRPFMHKWNHFEVRALVCLIIKGEHLASDDPMHVSDQLNLALNPAPSQHNKPNYGRDIPHDDVQNMLNRILNKKMHAVDVAERDSRGTVTRTKVSAFMRSLGFDGSKEEWAAGRKGFMGVEGEKRQRRYMARKEGARLSPRAEDERYRRRMLVRGPRVRRLLRGWGIGASFWDEGKSSPLHEKHSYGGVLTCLSPLKDSNNADRPRTRSKSSDLPSSRSATVATSRSSRITNSFSTSSTGNEVHIKGSRHSGLTHTSINNTIDPSAMMPNPAVAAWGGGFGPSPMPIPMTSTPLSSSIMPVQMIAASRYGYGGPGGFHAGPQQPDQSTGWNEDGSYQRRQ